MAIVGVLITILIIIIMFFVVKSPFSPLNNTPQNPKAIETRAEQSVNKMLENSKLEQTPVQDLDIK